MNYPLVSSQAVIPLDYRPSLQFSSYNKVPDRRDLDIPSPLTKTWRDRSARFASALAHEVRNPLTNINLSIDMLNSAITDSALKIYTDIITRSSIRINHLINELLLHQEFEETATNKYSVHQLLDEALTLTADRIMLKKIKVRKEYGAEDGKICVDRERICIALTNIIINAVEAMSAANYYRADHHFEHVRLETRGSD
jgi:nitrogen-specific signal transduction histidine kinase